MKILITGGAGFIGSHLAESLLGDDNEVFIIDDLSTGSMDNILHLKENSRFHYAIENIENVPVLAEVLDQCDLVYHLAAAVGVRLIVDNPTRTIETNVRGTEIVLKLAEKKKKLVVIASTSEVYGKGLTTPFREDSDLVLGPSMKARWSYACSKLLDEFLAFAYFREKEVPVIIVRLFNTVGPRQVGRYGMVLPTFIKQAQAGEPITVYGNGEQSRCFCYVGDTVWGLKKLAQCPQARGEVFNIGSEKEIKIIDLARLVKSIAKSNSEIVFIPYDQAYSQGFEDIIHRAPDVSKIRNLIGFTAKTELPEIIEKIIESFKK